MTSMFSAQARAEVVSNLLVNPGFESSNAGWTEFGSNGQPVDNINYEFGLGSGPQEGSLSLKLFQQFSGQPNEAGVYQDIAVMPNSRYELSGYLRNGNGSTQFMDYLDGPNAAFLRIVWLDSGLLEISRIDNNVPPQGITAATPQDNAWLFNQLQVESPGRYRLRDRRRDSRLPRRWSAHAHYRAFTQWSDPGRSPRVGPSHGCSADDEVHPYRHPRPGKSPLRIAAAKGPRSGDGGRLAAYWQRNGRLTLSICVK